LQRRHLLLWSLFSVQAAGCVFFLYDYVRDALGLTTDNFLTRSDALEVTVTLVMFAGLAFTGSELRRLFSQQARLSDQLAVASGAFDAVMRARFDTWHLTDAERDVAILALKGFSIAEIAGLRNTAQGTAKAQAAAVYRKAGVAGRLQLLSLFLEELMGDGLVPPARS
jgi:DNA-binding NarL/FixJ family response regulator